MLRIFPLYYGVLVLFLVVLPRLLDLQFTALPSIWFWTFTTNFAFDSGTRRGLVGHFWTLAIEEQFYLVWPIVYCSQPDNLDACLHDQPGGGRRAALLVESYGISSFMVTFCRIDTLLLGALLALAARSPRGLVDWSGNAVVVGVVSLVVALPLCVTLSGSGSVGLQVIKYPLIAVFYAAVLVIGVTAAPSSMAGWLFNLRPLRAWQVQLWPLCLSSSGDLRRSLVIRETVHHHGAHRGDTQLPVFVLKFALIFGVSFAIAWLSWHLYEKRFLVLKSYFEYDRAT